MFREFLAFIVLGFSLSIPVGAITIEMLKRGLRNGFMHAWFVGVGGMSADVLLMLLIYFGLANVLTGAIAQTAMWCFGFLVLVYLGISSIRDAFQSSEMQPSEHEGGSLAGAFTSGFIIAITNPINIVFWIGIYGSVLATLKMAMGSEMLLRSSAIFIGIAIWDLVLAGIVHYGKAFTGQRFMKWFSVAAGVVLIGFGLSFGWMALQNLVFVLF